MILPNVVVDQEFCYIPKPELFRMVVRREENPLPIRLRLKALHPGSMQFLDEEYFINNGTMNHDSLKYLYAATHWFIDELTLEFANGIYGHLDLNKDYCPIVTTEIRNIMLYHILWTMQIKYGVSFRLECRSKYNFK